MIPYIIEGLSLLLDGVFSNFLPYMENDLSYFTPLFTVVSIFMIYPFFRKKEKEFFINIFVLGFLYDLFYTNLLFWNGVIFLGIGFLSKILHKNFELGFFRLILYTILLVIVYEGFNGGLLFLFQVVPVTFKELLYKITHSVLMNAIYLEIIYLIIKLIPKKYKKISIN